MSWARLDDNIAHHPKILQGAAQYSATTAIAPVGRSIPQWSSDTGGRHLDLCSGAREVCSLSLGR
jgi:hypothetical protein